MTEYDWLYTSIAIVLVCTVALAGIYLEHRYRRAALRDFDVTIVCRCTHYGFDHSFWTGRCKFKTHLFGYQFECWCACFSPVKHFTIPDEEF